MLAQNFPESISGEGVLAEVKGVRKRLSAPPTT